MTDIEFWTHEPVAFGDLMEDRYAPLAERHSYSVDALSVEGELYHCQVRIPATMSPKRAQRFVAACYSEFCRDMLERDFELCIVIRPKKREAR